MLFNVTSNNISIILWQIYSVVLKYYCLFLDAEGPVHLELPNQWLWDIIDEFIYQVCLYIYIDTYIGASRVLELV
jgi:hypothetical protein